MKGVVFQTSTINTAVIAVSALAVQAIGLIDKAQRA